MPVSGMSRSSAKILSMAGRKTRSGNIRCLTGPISAHSCAAKASNSTDRSLELVEDEEAQRARQIAWFATMVDLGHQGVERQAAPLGNGRKLGPESILERHRSAMAVDRDRALAHGSTVAAAGRRLNPPCRRHRACV